MTKLEAKMIAEELYKLMRKDIRQAAMNMVEEETEIYLTMREASEFTRMSVTTIRRKIDEIPHTKIGGNYKFSKRALIQYMNRT